MPLDRAALHRHPRIVDGALAAFLFVFGLVSTRVTIVAGGLPTAPGFLVTVALFAALMFPLVWRRRYPLTVLAVVTAAFTAFRLVDIPEGTLSAVALFIALYGGGAYGTGVPRFWVRAACVLTLLGLLVFWLIVEDFADVASSVLLYEVILLLYNLFFFGAAWVLGDVMRLRREAERDLEQRATQLVAEREENARRAALDERVRIARELHDVVAHHVSVMGVQAGAARRVLHRDPAKAAAALAGIEAASRQTVDEMHRLLGFLRQEGEEDSRAPQPGLGQLDALLGQMRAAGLPVVLSVEGEPRPLPPGMDLSAYRVLQEALTNTLRHAGPATARVTMRYTDSALEVEIVDDGRKATAGNGATGHGLLGMRERIKLHGGQLRTGPRAGGGYAVSATFPVKSRG